MPIPHPQASNHEAASGAPPSALGLLRNSILFRHLDDSEAEAILADAQVRHYPEGAQIFAKGDPGDSMMAVLHGRAVISDSSLDGRQGVRATLREGDVFGEMALLDGKERSANATAAAECDLLVVRRNSFLSLLKHPPDTSLRLRF